VATFYMRGEKFVTFSCGFFFGIPYTKNIKVVRFD